MYVRKFRKEYCFDYIQIESIAMRDDVLCCWFVVVYSMVSVECHRVWFVENGTCGCVCVCLFVLYRNEGNISYRGRYDIVHSCSDRERERERKRERESDVQIKMWKNRKRRIEGRFRQLYRIIKTGSRKYVYMRMETKQ